MKSKPRKSPFKKKPPKKGKGSDLHPRVVISGYYGFDNLGDELILRVLVEELKTHQIHVTVLSQNPKKTAREYGVEAIKRTSFIDIVDALAQANLFISGGGGLFQDATGPMSAVYYGGLIHLARFFEVPVCFWAQGVGPLKGEFARKMTSSAIRKCEVVTVRDEGSAALVESLTGEEPEITADPVWLLNIPKKKPSATKAGRRKKDGDGPSPWRIGISLRPWPELTDARLKALADCLKQLAQIQAEAEERPVEFVLLPFQKQEDTHLLEDFGKRLQPCENAATILADPETIIDTVGECDAIVGMRFHSLILGLLQNVPIYGLVYDPKVAALLDMFNLQGTRIAELDGLDATSIQSYFSSYAPVDLKPMKQQSRRNFRVLRRLLAIPEAELVL